MTGFPSHPFNQFRLTARLRVQKDHVSATGGFQDLDTLVSQPCAARADFISLTSEDSRYYLAPRAPCKSDDNSWNWEATFFGFAALSARNRRVY